MSTTQTNKSTAVGRGQLLVFFLIVLCICMSGYGYFIHVKRILKKEKQQELNTIAELKAGHIAQWRRERLGDAKTLFANAMLASRLKDYLSGSGRPAVLKEFKVWMESLRHNFDYRSIALYGTDSRLLVSANDPGYPLDLDFRQLIKEAVGKQEAFFSDFHRDNTTGAIHLNLVVPLGLNQADKFLPVAVLVLDIDPHKFLYPLINTWPTASASGESTLVERNGNEALFLNDVRYQVGSALAMRLPLTDNSMPAVRAALGQEGVFEGKNYRGASVLAATRIIPGSPWAIVTNIDLAEIYEPIKTRTYWMILFSLMLTLAVGLVLYIWWFRKQGVSRQQQLTANNRELNARIEERTSELSLERDNLKAILDTMNNGVYIVNQDLVIKYTNPALQREYGPIEGRTCHEYLHGSPGVCPWCNNTEVFSGQINHREWTSEITGKTYSTVDTPYRSAEGELCKLAILHDITEQKKAESIIINHSTELEQRIVERTKSLEQANQELVAINNELELRRREAERTQEIAHLGSWELDLENGQLTWSDEVYRIFGLLPKEFPASYGAFLEAVHPEDRDAINDAYLGSIKENREYDAEHRVIRPQTGEIRYVHEKCEHLRDTSGNVVRSVGMVHDITEHKLTAAKLRDLAALLELKNSSLEEANEELVVSNNELEQRRHEAEMTQKKLQQLSSAVENSPVSIIITDNQGRIEYVNPKFTEISGYLPEETIGENPRILKADGQPEKLYRELWETICSGKEWRGDLCNRKKNGVIHWEHASISPIRDKNGIITHFVAIKEDVTEQREVARELVITRDAAAAANRSKSEFLANMSHEIRTPLNSIIGFSGLVLKTSLPPLQQDYISKIHSAGEQLLNIIGDILDFSKIEAGQLNVEHIPFRLDTIIGHAFSMVQQKALDKGLNVAIEEPPEAASCLVGDPHRLGQVIVNLMSNAVKFTEQGKVVLETSLLSQEDDRIQLRFRIGDTGIGIATEQAGNLFKPFTQADGSTTRRFGGTGLGLSISKQLVNLMGGEIWCQSAPGQGSNFFFTTWFGVCQEQDLEKCNYNCSTNTEDARSSFNFTGFRVLLVEDNEINRQLAIELLKETGAEVHVAENGQAAVMMVTCGNTSYDLVLMDIQMPVMDGYEATRLIRSDSRFSHLPIIAMTAHAMQDEQEKILRAGTDAHISKPINAQTMLKVMSSFLREQESSISRTASLTGNSCNEPAIPDIEGLDITGSLERLDGNRKLFLWVLRMFIEKESDTAGAIGEALRVGDMMLALRHAHTIKATAGTMGAVNLEELALSLENGISQGESIEQLEATLGQFAAELSRLVTELRHHFPMAQQVCGSTRPGGVNLELAAQILNTLQGYIKGRDGKAERYLDDFGKDMAGLPDQDIKMISSHLKNFDFTTASAVLLSLATKVGVVLAPNEQGEVPL